MEFLVAITVSFPHSASQSLVLFMSVPATTGHPNAQDWNLGVTVDSSLFLHPHIHPISKPHLVISFHLLCPILVPAAHFSYQDFCNSPSMFALGLLQSILCKSTTAIFAVGTSHCGSLLTPLLPLRLFPLQDQLCWLFPPSICSPVFPGPTPSHLALCSPSKVGLHPQHTQQ